MEFAFVVLAYAALAAFFTTSLSLPVKNKGDNDKEIQNSTDLPMSEDFDLPKEVITNVLKETFNQVNEVPNVIICDKHTILKRSKRGVIIGGLCAKGQCRLPSGDCIPCSQLQNGGDDDYSDSDNEVE